MNGYCPIVELMNTNCGIFGMADLSSSGNTFEHHLIPVTDNTTESNTETPSSIITSPPVSISTPSSGMTIPMILTPMSVNLIHTVPRARRVKIIILVHN